MDQFVNRQDLCNATPAGHHLGVFHRLRAGEQHELGRRTSTGQQHRLEVRFEVDEVADMVRPSDCAIVSEADPSIEAGPREKSSESKWPLTQFLVGDPGTIDGGRGRAWLGYRHAGFPRS